VEAIRNALEEGHPVLIHSGFFPDIVDNFLKNRPGAIRFGHLDAVGGQYTSLTKKAAFCTIISKILEMVK